MMNQQLWDDVHNAKQVVMEMGFEQTGMLVDAFARFDPLSSDCVREVISKAKEEGANGVVEELIILATQIDNRHAFDAPMCVILDHIAIIACVECAPHSEAWLNGLAEDIAQEEYQHYSKVHQLLLSAIKDHKED